MPVSGVSDSKSCVVSDVDVVLDSQYWFCSSRLAIGDHFCPMSSMAWTLNFVLRCLRSWYIWNIDPISSVVMTFGVSNCLTLSVGSIMIRAHLHHSCGCTPGDTPDRGHSDTGYAAVMVGHEPGIFHFIDPITGPPILLPASRGNTAFRRFPKEMSIFPTLQQTMLSVLFDGR